MNDSMTRLIKPLITCICAHYRQTNQICSKLFFFNQSKHILIFIQELCIYKTITFYDSSLVKKKIGKFFFSIFFSSHPVAYSRPPCENHWSNTLTWKAFHYYPSSSVICGSLDVSNVYYCPPQFTSIRQNKSPLFNSKKLTEMYYNVAYF